MQPHKIQITENVLNQSFKVRDLSFKFREYIYPTSLALKQHILFQSKTMVKNVKIDYHIKDIISHVYFHNKEKFLKDL